MDLPGGAAVVPAVEQQPKPVDGGAEHAQHDDHLQVQTAQKFADLGHGEQQGVLVAPAGVEPTMGESKSPALPLGDGALSLFFFSLNHQVALLVTL